MYIAMIGQKGVPATYGGVERHVEDLAVSLVSRGHDVMVYGRSWYARKISSEYRGMRVVNLPSIHTKHLDTISHVFLATWHAMFSRVDVIHYHGVGPALLAWMPRVFAPRIKVVGTFHSIDRYHQKWGWFARLVLRLGEWAVCHFPHVTLAVSGELQNYCLNEYGCNAVYIPNGVSVNEKKDNSECLRNFNLETEKYLVMVSRLIPHKGVHVLVEAFDNLQKKGIAKDLKLVIVGGAVHTEDYAKLVQNSVAHNPNIIFTGFLEGEVARTLVAGSLACVHPSFNEGLPISVLEAMAESRPVLLSKIPAHLEMMPDKKVLFKENSVSDLEDKLVEFFGWSDETRKEIGEANRNIVIQKYSLDRVADGVEEVYCQLVLRGRTSGGKCFSLQEITQKGKN